MNTGVPKLPSILQTINTNKLLTKKSLGQHFLTDSNLLDKIVMSSGDATNDAIVLEIGPGPGGLTRSILSMRQNKVICIEKDQRCIPILTELSKHYKNRLVIMEADALNLKLSDIAPDGVEVVVIANLPYNISTELLINWLSELEKIESMTLMFQKEVAQRIIAQPGSKQYGRLSVLCQWLCEARMLFDISPNAFTPPPKVESTVLYIKPRAKPLFPAKREDLEIVCKAAFGQRRKMLRSSLKQITSEPDALLKKCGIKNTLRPEELSVEQFCIIARDYPDFRKV